MSIRQLIEKILNKWPAKIICFLLAIFLYVFHQVSLVEKKSFVVPLNVIENGMVSHVSQIPSTVSVVVKANSNAVNTITPSDITATLDLDDITDVGKYELPVNIKISDRLMEFDPLEIRVSPEHISTKIEIKKARFVKIKPTLEPIPKLLSGDDVMDLLNIKPSAKLGQIMNLLHETQLSGEVITYEGAVNFVKSL